MTNAARLSSDLGRFLLWCGAIVTAVGAVCAGLGWGPREIPPQATHDAGMPSLIFGGVTVIVGIGLLVIGIVCRCIARMLRGRPMPPA